MALILLPPFYKESKKSMLQKLERKSTFFFFFFKWSLSPCVAQPLLSLSCDAALHDTSFEPERFEGSGIFHALCNKTPH